MPYLKHIEKNIKQENVRNIGHTGIKKLDQNLNNIFGNHGVDMKQEIKWSIVKILSKI